MLHNLNRGNSREESFHNNNWPQKNVFIRIPKSLQKLRLEASETDNISKARGSFEKPM